MTNYPHFCVHQSRYRVLFFTKPEKHHSSGGGQVERSGCGGVGVSHVGTVAELAFSYTRLSHHHLHTCTRTRPQPCRRETITNSTCGGAASTRPSLLGTTWNIKMPTWVVTKARMLQRSRSKKSVDLPVCSPPHYRARLGSEERGRYSSCCKMHPGSI